MVIFGYDGNPTLQVRNIVPLRGQTLSSSVDDNVNDMLDTFRQYLHQAKLNCDKVHISSESTRSTISDDFVALRKAEAAITDTARLHELITLARSVLSM